MLIETRDLISTSLYPRFLQTQSSSYFAIYSTQYTFQRNLTLKLQQLIAYLSHYKALVSNRTYNANNNYCETINHIINNKFSFNILSMSFFGTISSFSLCKPPTFFLSSFFRFTFIFLNFSQSIIFLYVLLLLLILPIVLWLFFFYINSSELLFLYHILFESIFLIFKVVYSNCLNLCAFRLTITTYYAYFV